MSILTQIGKGIRVAGHGLLRAPEGAMINPLARGALEYGAYSTAGWAVNEYAKGNFENEGSRNVAGAAAFLLKAKGMHSLALGGTRTIGEIGGRIQQRYKGATGQKIGGILASLRAPGKNLHYAVGMETPVGYLQRGSMPWYEAPEKLRNNLRPLGKAATRVSTYTTNRAAGSVDQFISGLNPFTVPFRAAKWAGKGLLNLPGSVAKGTMEYGRVFSTASRTTKAHGARSGWGALTAGFANMEHPLAPMVIGGGAFGVARAFGERYQYGANGFEESLYSAPLTSPDTLLEGPVGAAGSIDPSNFPGGVSIGRGHSAVRSQTVMEGQQAVTTKMLTHRRV